MNQPNDFGETIAGPWHDRKARFTRILHYYDWEIGRWHEGKTTLTYDEWLTLWTDRKAALVKRYLLGEDL